jgi:hypothetical protein
MSEGYEFPPARGRYHKFGADQEHEILSWIEAKARNDAAVNRTELLHYCSQTFATLSTPEVGRFLHLSAFGQLVRRKSVPEENPRLDIPRTLFDAAAQGS